MHISILSIEITCRTQIVFSTYIHTIIYMDVVWAAWHLKSLAPRMLDQRLSHVNSEETSNIPIVWPLWGQSTDRATGWFPSQSSSNAESLFMAVMTSRCRRVINVHVLVVVQNCQVEVFNHTCKIEPYRSQIAHKHVYPATNAWDLFYG